MNETLANGYSFESTHQELFNEYQHDRVLMILKIICIPMLWTKVPSALEGLKSILLCNLPHLDISGSMDLAEGLLHSFAHLPDDRLGRLVLEGPFTGQ